MPTEQSDGRPDASVETTLRPAEADDLPAVAEVYLAAREAAVGAMPPGVHPPHEVREWVRGWDLGSQEVWLATTPEGQVLGYAQLTPTWLDGLYVEPSSQGLGLGSALLDLAKARRPQGFCLWVFVSNHPARRLYRHAGLVELDQTQGDNEEGAPDVRMAWPGEAPLAFYRGLIDEVDEQLGRLLSRRAALTAAVRAARPGQERDHDREAEIVRRISAQAPTLGPDRVARILDAVIGASLDAARQPPEPPG